MVGDQAATPAALRDAAEQLQRQLSEIWSSDTAHPSVDYASARSKSAGQCYVSSMALARVIERRWPDIKPWICRGALRHGHRTMISDHGWVAAIVDRREYLFDLTVEQGVPAHALIALPSATVSELDLEYIETERRRLCQVDNLGVWSRYLILESELVARFDRTASGRALRA